MNIHDVNVVAQGVENIYTQHKPQLHDVLDQLLKGKLREAAFPYMGNTQLRDRSDTNCSFLLCIFVLFYYYFYIFNPFAATLLKSRVLHS